MTQALDGIVLDLDDTLIDTSRLLVPAADERAADALVAGGAPESVETLVGRFRTLRAAGDTHVFRTAAQALNLDESVAESAEVAFFRYDVPDLALDDQVATTLDTLRSLAPLALLTFGDPDTQQSKIDRLDLERWFTVFEIVARGGPEGKPAVLARLLDAHGWRPDHVVVCGDNPASDVRAAHACGCTSVLVRRPGAEFANAAIHERRDRPDHVIASVTELPGLLMRRTP